MLQQLLRRDEIEERAEVVRHKAVEACVKKFYKKDDKN